MSLILVVRSKEDRGDLRFQKSSTWQLSGYAIWRFYGSIYRKEHLANMPRGFVGSILLVLGRLDIGPDSKRLDARAIPGQMEQSSPV